MAIPSEQIRSHATRHRGTVECEALLATANKELFNKNVFRITGLPVDVTTREANRQMDELKMRVELGESLDNQNVAYPIKPPPNLDDIREATQKLKEPEKRLIDEFFWFWPLDSGHSKSDPALQALAKGDTKTANEIWQGKLNDESNGIVAKHNLAVAYFMIAIQMEYQAIGLTISEDRRQKITETWKSSIRKWKRIAQDDKLWEKVADRIRQLSEANLPTGFARRMRASFPEAFHTINVELILNIAKSGNVDLAKQYIQYLCEHSQMSEGIKNSVERVLLPIKNRLQEQIRQAEDRAENNPRDAANAVHDLIKQSRQTLCLFDIFYGDNSDERNELYDEVAAICHRLPVSYQKATGDNKTCLEILRLVLPFVTSAELRNQIQENIRILNNNIENQKDKEIFKDLSPIKAAPELKTINGIGLTLYGSTDHDPKTGSCIATYYFVIFFIPILPICRYRVIRNGNSYRFLGKARLRTFDKWHIAIVIGFIIATIIICNSGDGATSVNISNNPPSASAATTYTPSSEPSQSTPSYAPTPSSSGENVYSVPSDVSSQLDKEKQKIEADRVALKQMQDQLDALGQKVDTDRVNLDSTSQSAVDAFNAEVEQYNTLLQKTKAATDAFNQRVDDYNSKLQTYGK